MNDGYEQHQRRMAADHYLKPSDEWPCPRVVAGKYCKRSGGKACICGDYSRLLDHCHIWQNASDDFVLTAEPYSANGEDLAAFIAEVGKLGLEVEIIGRSPWYPNGTFLIYVTRRSAKSIRPAA